MHKVGFKYFNHIGIGVILGLIIPLVTMHIVLKMNTPNFTLLYLIENPMFSPVLNNLKGCLFINLPLFFLFYLIKRDKSARGVIFATLIYGAFYLYYMFFV